jgi:two-component system C4-dicarboxylate transport sensor histidine kinase DctB
MTSPRSSSTDLRLALYVAGGLLAGAAYVAFDVVSEARIGKGTLTGAIAHAHTVVDRVFPIVVGALLGLAVHYYRVRGQLAAAEEAAARAEGLRLRLQKVERDQAVWVLVAAVLHELHNPLHALGLLMDELVSPEVDEERRRDLVARARAQSERALRHLRSLRSLRGVEDPRLEDVALDRVVGSLAEDARALAETDGLAIRVECERPLRAQADLTYLRTIVENLVDNGLQSLRSRGSGSITIRLESEPGRAIVRVSDDGPPLDTSLRATLFEPLASTKPNGLGLGLPIARALARAMRGDLSFDDAHGKSFRLELPAREAS